MEEQTQPTPDQKTETLFDGLEITAVCEGGSTEQIKIQQFKLGQYQAAFIRIDDEFNLVSLACGKKDGWAITLTPDCYEAILAAVQKVNARGFFAYAERRQAQLVQRLNSLTPQMLKAASEAATSSTSLQRPRPRQA